MRIYLDLEKEGGETVHAVAPDNPLSLAQQIASPRTISEEIFKGPAVLRRAIGDRVDVHFLLERNDTPEEESEGQALKTRSNSWAENCFAGTRPGLRGSPGDCCSHRTK